MGLGDMLGGALRVYRTRFWSFLSIYLMPYVVTALLYVLGAALISVSAYAMFGQAPTSGRIVGGIALIMLISVVMIAGMIFAFVKGMGMTARLCYDTLAHSDATAAGAQAGSPPGFSDAWEGTRGFVGRALTAVLILIGATVAIMVIFGGLVAWMVVGIVQAARSSGEHGVASIVISVIVMVLVYLAVLVLGIIVQIRLYPLIPTIASERIGGMDALRRAWSLTRGYGLRTFGYMIVAGLIVGGIIYLAELIGYFAGGISSMAPILAQDSGEVPVGATVVSLLVMMLPVLIVGLVVTPYSAIFQALYTIDLQRRERLGLRPGQPVATGYYPPPQGWAPQPPPQQGWTPPPGQQPYPPQPPPGQQPWQPPTSQ